MRLRRGREPRRLSRMVSRYVWRRVSCGPRLLMFPQQRVEREVAEHEFIDRLYLFWDTNYRGALSFQVSILIPSAFVWPDHRKQDLVSGLDGVMFNDLMENIEWFFNLHDKNKDGFLTKDEVLTLSESLLVSYSR